MRHERTAANGRLFVTVNGKGFC